MINLVLLFIAGGYLSAIAWVIVLDRARPDRFSPVKLVSYFALVEGGVMLWFALVDGGIERAIFGQISASYHDPILVVLAYMLSVCVYFLVLGGVVLGAYVKARPLEYVTRVVFPIDKVSVFASGVYPLVLYLVGFAIYAWFIHEVGGLAYIWANIHMRTLITAGYGYYQAAFTFLLMIGTCFVYVALARRKRHFLALVAVIIAAAALASLGQRAPVAKLFFSLLLVHHFCVREVSIVGARTAILAVSLLAFMFAFVQLRPGQVSGSFLERFEVDVVQRLGVIERQVVVLGHFDGRTSYWGDALYQSLMYAPIPRSVFKDKPPVDTGVYLNQLRQGVVPTPPTPANDLPPSSWPDGFLAGYMSAGFAGLVVVALCSGWVLGMVYRMMRKSRCSVPYVALYGFLGFMGATPLSPLGIVQTLEMLMPFAFLGFLGWGFSLAKRLVLTSGKLPAVHL